MSDEPDEGKARRERRTFRGYHRPEVGTSEEGSPLNEEVARAAEAADNKHGAQGNEGGAPAPAGNRGGDEVVPTRPYTRTPLVEIEVVHQHGPAPRSERPWRTLEVWTRNRVYVMDPTMVCIEVIDRITSKNAPEHAFIGSRLVGGQHREGQRIELSCPFPRPGTEAVFEHPKGQRGSFSRTSTVTRVVLRLHVVTVAPSYVVPTWETITGSMPVVPPDE